MATSFGRTLLIANPTAQRGNGAKAAEEACHLLERRLGEGALEFAATNHPKHAIEIAAAATTERFDTVLVLGGDGAIHEAVNGLMRISPNERPRFGIIPVGSGNDYARTLGMPEGVHEGIAKLLAAHEAPIDIGCCNGEFFAETLSFGLDAAIALDTVQRRKRTGEQGTILYLKSGLDQLLHHLEAFEFEAVLEGGGPIEMLPRTRSARRMRSSSFRRKTSDDAANAGAQDSARRTLKGCMHMMAVQVGQTYGGGFRICPDADPTDGLLDICYADAPMNVTEATIKFLSAKDGHHGKFDNVHFERASRIELAFDKRPPCQIDGEPHIADSYSISIEQHALRVLMG